MSQCDYVSTPVARTPEVRKESEEFRRESVDRRDRVPPRPDEVEDLESALLENVELKHNMRQPQSTRPFLPLV